MSIDRSVNEQDRSAVGTEGPTGRFRLDLAAQVWQWSDEMFDLHGFRPGEVVPTTQLVLAHHRPQDREDVARMLSVAQAAAPAPRPVTFGRLHHIVDAQGVERVVAVAGELEWSAGAAALVGYVTDVSRRVRVLASGAADRQIHEAGARRGVIEQAKGALAVVYDVDLDAAFELLRTASNHLNVPVRELARTALDAAVVPGRRRRDRVDAVLGRHPAADPSGPSGTGSW